MSEVGDAMLSAISMGRTDQQLHVVALLLLVSGGCTRLVRLACAPEEPQQHPPGQRARHGGTAGGR